MWKKNRYKFSILSAILISIILSQPSAISYSSKKKNFILTFIILVLKVFPSRHSLILISALPIYTLCQISQPLLFTSLPDIFDLRESFLLYEFDKCVQLLSNSVEGGVVLAGGWCDAGLFLLFELIVQHISLDKNVCDIWNMFVILYFLFTLCLLHIIPYLTWHLKRVFWKKLGGNIADYFRDFIALTLVKINFIKWFHKDDGGLVLSLFFAWNDDFPLNCSYYFK